LEKGPLAKKSSKESLLEHKWKEERFCSSDFKGIKENEKTCYQNGCKKKGTVQYTRKR